MIVKKICVVERDNDFRAKIVETIDSLHEVLSFSDLDDALNESDQTESLWIVGLNAIVGIESFEVLKKRVEDENSPLFFTIHDGQDPNFSRSQEIASVAYVFRSQINQLKYLVEGVFAKQDANIFQNLISALPCFFWEVNPETMGFTFVSENVEAITGYSSAEWAVPNFWVDHLHPEDKEWAIQFCTMSTDEGVNHEFEYRFRHKDGHYLWLKDIVSLYVVNGTLKKLYGSMHDVSGIKKAYEEKKQLEVQILQTQKLESLGLLAGGIAHDFNNILQSSFGYADLAMLKLSAMSPARPYIDEIKKSAQLAADLCQQMLAYSGKGRFSVETVSINELIEEMSHLIEISISKKAVLRYEAGENLPLVKADPSQIRQVMMNLVINASEAIGDQSGVISITTGAMHCDASYLNSTFLIQNLPEGPYVYFEVSDTGCGMDSEALSKIFDPFYTTKFTGRGLGLAAVLGIARGHKGALKVYSEPKRGTTFKVLFPAADHSAISKPKKSANQDSWSGSGTVLLVDDDETICTVGEIILSELGFTVLSAPDGQVAVDLYRDHQEDLICVILDLTMPRMDGEEAFREMRLISSDIPVILSSGYNEQEIINRFVGKKLAGFLKKPYDRDKLIAKLRETLEKNGQS